MSLKHKIGRLVFKLFGSMPCKQFEGLAYDYLDGNLDNKKTKAINRHMKLCPPCIHFIDSYRRTRDIVTQEERPNLDPTFKKHLLDMYTSQEGFE